LPQEYEIGRHSDRCIACGRELRRGEEFFSALAAGAPASAPGKVSDTFSAPAPAGEAAPPPVGAPAQPEPARLPYRRMDFCAGCWRPEMAAEYFSFWKTAVPDEDPDRDKPLARRIDTETVYDLFRRLEAQPEPEKRKFRFILALILMRKKRLRFTGVAKGPSGEHLVLEDRSEGVTHKVLDPGLAEEEIDSLRGEVDRLLRGGAGAAAEADPAGAGAPS